MKKILCMLIMLFGLISPASAEIRSDVDLWFYQKSWHVDDDEDYNEFHTLLGYRNKNLLVAAFNNSYNDFSIAALYFKKLEPFTLNITPHYAIGLASGYKELTKDNVGIIPYGFIGLDIHPKSDSFGIIINTLPGEVTTIGFRKRF